MRSIGYREQNTEHTENDIYDNKSEDIYTFYTNLSVTQTSI